MVRLIHYMKQPEKEVLIDFPATAVLSHAQEFEISSASYPVTEGLLLRFTILCEMIDKQLITIEYEGIWKEGQLFELDLSSYTYKEDMYFDPMYEKDLENLLERTTIEIS